jgi:Cu(I)/Ag(I) efflux system membrane fusion protein
VNEKWKRFLLVVKVIEVRLRFIAILVAVGLFIGYWDTAKNYWDKWTRPQSVAVRELATDQEFFCPMHPNVVRTSYEPNGDVPNCPICGMPLSLRKKGEKEVLPLGITGRVQFSPERIQLAGIKTAPIGYRPLAKQTTTVGFVTFDESRLSRVVTRVEGYVEKLYVDKTFMTVREGQPLAEIYSPELYSAVQELLLAARGSIAGDLLPATRRKLSLLGVSEQEIETMVKTQNATPRLVIRSPQSGYVIDKKIVAGSSIEKGMTLLEVADLSAVWVEADVFEKDIGMLQVGQHVEATVEAFPNRVFHGRLALIYPRLDTATRTNRVRFALENPGHELRPGMFASVRIDTPLEATEPYRSLAAKGSHVIHISKGALGNAPQSQLLAVPEQAVVDTGTKKIVYVEREPGTFDGVEVQLGPRVGEYYPVIQGLQPGDRIAAAGSFLIDAETRLNPAAGSSYSGANGGPHSHGSHKAAPSSSTSPASQATPAEEPTAKDLQRIAELPEADRHLAHAQKLCPITGKPLGSMGVPIKITLRDKPVFLCCKGCVGQANRDPEETLKKIASP